jgi:hypothetical protein
MKQQFISQGWTLCRSYYLCRFHIEVSAGTISGFRLRLPALHLGPSADTADSTSRAIRVIRGSYSGTTRRSFLQYGRFLPTRSARATNGAREAPRAPDYNPEMSACSSGRSWSDLIWPTSVLASSSWPFAASTAAWTASAAGESALRGTLIPE